MQTINNKEFGQFLNELRKEKGLTQKQLAEQLFLSDKAVSKWERGLSFPDISLLIPLSKILEVTTTELLSGKR
ncbi:MAG: helix-turn-helix transcriptional regulator, partial [Cellulosilyticaceae bacterium]